MDQVFELRRYRLRPGARERLIDLFEQRFVEPQRAAGMTVLGRYRMPDDLDAFVWLRAFSTMERRRQALEAFYGGPVWQAHRDAANATMINSDNVQLLRPAWDGSGLAESAGREADVVVATVSSCAPGTAAALAALYRTKLLPVEQAMGGTLLGAFVTEHAENSFPRLPVRAGEETFVRLVAYADRPQAAAAWTAVRTVPDWAPYDERIWRPDETMLLEPVRD